MRRGTPSGVPGPGVESDGAALRPGVGRPEGTDDGASDGESELLSPALGGPWWKTGSRCDTLLPVRGRGAARPPAASHTCAIDGELRAA